MSDFNISFNLFGEYDNFDDAAEEREIEKRRNGTKSYNWLKRLDQHKKTQMKWAIKKRFPCKKNKLLL